MIIQEFEPGEFLGKRVLVAGGSSGIGLSTAKAFNHEGASVAVIDIGDRPEFIFEPNFIKANIGDLSDVERGVAAAASVLGGIDILINGAAKKVPGNILDITQDQLIEMFKVNSLGFAWITRCVLPHLMKSEGTLVGLCSATSEELPPNNDGYFLTKGSTFGAINSTYSSAKHNNWKVRIVGIGFGPVDTPLWRSGQSNEFISKAISGQWDGPRVLSSEAAASYVLKVASKRNREHTQHIFRP